MNVNDQAEMLTAMMNRITALERAISVAPYAPYVELAGDTMTGELIAPTARLTSVDDASLGSTLHAFQIGPDDALNLVLDPNEIICRDNGAVGNLFLNNTGGNTRIGNGGAFRVEDDGTITDDTSRHFLRGNSVELAQIIQHDETTQDTDANGDITITFTDEFTSIPTVTAMRSSGGTGERTCHIYGVSTTGFSARCFNGGTLLGAGTSIILHWIAVGNL